jgi:hypothetical protein
MRSSTYSDRSVFWANSRITGLSEIDSEHPFIA